MIYIYLPTIVIIIYICNSFYNKLNKISQELVDIKKEFYFVDTELKNIKDKTEYIEFILLEIEQDAIQNYKHLDDKFSIFYKHVMKEMKMKTYKHSGLDLDTMG